VNITIVSVGKIKEKYIKLGMEEFQKRLSKYCKLSLIEVADEKAPENMSEKEMENVKKAEGQRILSNVKEGSYAITLEIGGNMLSSEELANKMEKLGVSGKSDITFIIGGSIGLSDEVLRRSDYGLSFSRMTFPHQLMRLILIEQIYRSYRIMRNEPYHK